MALLSFFVPPGIGDISWCYSKVSELAKRRKISFQIASNPPQRSSDFVNLLPNIENAGYTTPWPLWMDKNGVLSSETYDQPMPLWKETDLELLPDGHYTLFLNVYLEHGDRLETCFPNQKTDYHYELLTSNRERLFGKNCIEAMQGSPKIGFYCSSNRHRSEYSFWTVNQWVEFFQKVNNFLPNAAFLALGADYDDRTIEVYQAMRQSQMKVATTVGALNIAGTIEIIRNLDYFFAFPSGLGILADVVNTPSMMWYWKGVTDSFINTYADPDNITHGRHINLLYDTVENSFNIFKYKALRYLCGIGFDE